MTDLLGGFRFPGQGDQVLFLVTVAILVLMVVVAVFAGVTLVLRLRNDWKARRWARLEERWGPLILEVLDGTRKPADLWERVQVRDSLYFVNFLLRYARRLRGGEERKIRELARPFLPRVVLLVTRGTPERRARAIQTLAVLGLPEFDEGVLRGLDDPSPMVAMVAARGLAEPEHPEYLPEILERIDRFRVWNPRLVASMLASVGPEAAPALRETLEDRSRGSRVRVICARALAALNDAASADAAANLLAVEEDRNLVVACLEILETVGTEEHLPGVRRLTEHPDAPIRLAAVKALGSLGESEDVERLVRALSEDPSPWVALHSARGLARLGAHEHLRKLVPEDHPRSELALEVLAAR